MDIGGSDGELSLMLLEKFPLIQKLYLVDVSPEMTALAQRRKFAAVNFTPSLHGKDLRFSRVM